MDGEWLWQLRNRVRYANLKDSGIDLSEAEREYLLKLEREESLPFAATPYYLGLAREPDGLAVRRQCIPDPREANRVECELDDPLGEAMYSPTRGLVHQYKNRVLLLATDECATYCRHCFRRGFAGRTKGAIGKDELEAALSYIEGKEGIEEILVSGGDPFTASDDRVFELLSAIRKALPNALIRACTRTPVTLPQRFEKKFLSLLNGFRPLWILTHFNHRVELSPRACEALGDIIDSGIPIANQTVLLKGVNDDPRILANLFTELTRQRVTPLYLFQSDLAPGTSHFRVPLRRGLQIYRELKELCSGLALPKYAVDLPGGGGKTLLGDESISRPVAGAFAIRGQDGKDYMYPDELEL